MFEADAVNYIRRNKVEGWLTPVAAETSLLLLRHCRAAGRPVAEIGVHHGKYLIFLGILTRGRVVGFDLFETLQAENIDRSGKGNREMFLDNARRSGLPPEDCVAVTANSLRLDGAQVVRACGEAPVFFSVDGGHTAELTENDIRIAEAAVADDGVVAVDDVFNERWPGVVEGLLRYLDGGAPILVPCAIGGNKVFLVKGEERARAMSEALMAGRATPLGYITSASHVQFRTWPVAVMETVVKTRGLLEGLATTPQGLALSRSFIGPRLKALVRPLLK
jgi:hypothetical protein